MNDILMLDAKASTSSKKIYNLRDSGAVYQVTVKPGLAHGVSIFIADAGNKRLRPRDRQRLAKIVYAELSA